MVCLHLKIPDIIGEIKKVRMGCFQKRVIANFRMFVDCTNASIHRYSRRAKHSRDITANAGYTDEGEDEPSHGYFSGRKDSFFYIYSNPGKNQTPKGDFILQTLQKYLPTYISSCICQKCSIQPRS